MRTRVLRVVSVLAAIDWLLAFAMTVVGLRRQISIPLLGTAAAVLIGSQSPRLAHLIDAVRFAAGRDLSRWSAAEAVLAEQWSPRVARLVLREPRLLWSVLLLLRGRRDGEPALTFSSHREALPVWSLLGAVALLEVVGTRLLPLPPGAHAVLLVLGVWGLVVVVGLIAALVVHPHLVTNQVIRLRFGFWDEIVVPRAAVTRVRITAAGTAPRGLHVVPGEASLSPSGVTNMELDLEPPLTVGDELVTCVRFYADSPRSLASACAPAQG